MTRTTRFLILASCVLAACSTPEPRYYALDAVAPPAARRSAGPPMLLAPVAIPAEVDRPQMVLDAAGSEVTIDDGHRWASPLQSAITQALANGLASALGDDRVATDDYGANWTGYRIDVRIVAFDSRLDRNAPIDARWQVRRDGVVRNGTASVQEPASGGFDGLAQAHGRALSRLSAEIAATVAQLDARAR